MVIKGATVYQQLHTWTLAAMRCSVMMRKVHLKTALKQNQKKGNILENSNSTLTSLAGAASDVPAVVVLDRRDRVLNTNKHTETSANTAPHTHTHTHMHAHTHTHMHAHTHTHMHAHIHTHTHTHTLTVCIQ